MFLHYLVAVAVSCSRINDNSLGTVRTVVWLEIWTWCILDYARMQDSLSVHYEAFASEFLENIYFVYNVSAKYDKWEINKFKYGVIGLLINFSQ